MKFIIVSNAPNVPSGYGMQTAMLALRLQADGHDVAVASTYGQQAEIGNWRGIRVYPQSWTDQHEALGDFFMHWFDGDPRGGWVIVLTDVWALRYPLFHEFNVIAWTPVDHDPVSPMVVDWLRRAGAKPVAMSKFGQRALTAAGVECDYIPLATDLDVYKPTPHLTIADETVDARTYLEVPHDAFVVGMVAMNKDPGDRKGFNEAFYGFAEFHRTHPNSVLLIHNEPHGIQGGIDLVNLAEQAGIPKGVAVWTHQLAYRLGFSRGMMAALYTACDVLLAPSRGEGFGVPLIEAQACGIPVIVSDFTAQPELVGAGWLVDGQREYDPPHRSNWFRAFSSDVAAKLAAAYDTLDDPDVAVKTGEVARAFVEAYDADHVYATYWRPFIATLEPTKVERPVMERVDVIVPFAREENRARLTESFDRANDGTANLILWDAGDRTYAENVNAAYATTTADFIAVVGDDCEFAEGWIEAARTVSTVADVIGTNDSEEGRTRNPDVAAGRHADHFLIRRSYIDDEGSSLDGPGIVMPTCYRHWYTDKEVIGLARARGVYAHAHESRIIHHHPGYDGDEAARRADPVYMAAVEGSEKDAKTFRARLPLIENHRA